MRETLIEVSDLVRADVSPELSFETYQYLKGEIQESKHGSRFQIREFDTPTDLTDNVNPLDVAYPLSVANDVDPDTQLWLAKTAGSVIMPPDNWTTFVESFKDIYADESIKKHLKLGGSVLFLSNHVTYADQPAEIAASTQAKLESGQEQPHYEQDIIVHRLVSLFRHDLISTLYELDGRQHKGGMIMEDLLLQFANVIQTFPRSGSGYERFIQKVKDGHTNRSVVNLKVQEAFQRLINLGGRSIFIAGGGTEGAYDSENNTYQEATVSRSTTNMIIEPNDHKRAKRLLTIPLYIHADPFTDDIANPLLPARTPFVFLKPRFISSPKEVHDAMIEVTEVGNQYKPSGKPTIKYDAPGPDWVRKSVKPEIWLAHSE